MNHNAAFLNITKLFIIGLLFGSSAGINSADAASRVKIKLRKSANTCGQFPGATPPSIYCTSNKLISAEVVIRPLYQKTSRKLTADLNGNIIVKLEPGYYQIGLSYSYSGKLFQIAQGSDVGNACYPTSVYKDEIPREYNSGDDFAIKAEAERFFHVDNTKKTFTITYNDRCV